MLLRTAKLLRGVRAAVRAEEWAVVRRLLASWKSTASGDAESEPVQEPDSAEQDSDELWPGLAESARKEVSSAATAARAKGEGGTCDDGIAALTLQANPT